MEAALFFSPPIIFGLGMILLVVIGAAISCSLMSGPRRVPPGRAQPTVRPDRQPVIFTAHNVQLDHSYVILEDGDRSTLVQEFQILDRRMDYFLISVNVWGGPDTNRSRTFKGWAAKIRGDRYIQPEDLLTACPV